MCDEDRIPELEDSKRGGGTRGPLPRVSDEELILSRETRRRWADEKWCYGLGSGLPAVTDQSDIVRLFAPLAEPTDGPVIQLLSLELSGSFLHRARELWPDSSYNARNISALLQSLQLELAMLRSPTLQEQSLHLIDGSALAEKASFYGFTQAYFAQKEVAKFCLSQRQHSPLAFANATAGLPLIGCAQSMRRCIKLQEDDRLARSNDNSRFAISYLSGSLVRHLQKRVASDADASFKRDFAEKWLRNCHSDLKQSLRDLRSNRAALLDAVELGYTSKHDANEYPYIIAGEYLRLVREQTHLRDFLPPEHLI